MPNPDPSSHKPPKFHIALPVIVTALLVVSAIKPHDYLTWLLEVFPALIAMPLLMFTYRRFRLTTLAYTLIAVHASILILGGHYTYAEVPIGHWAAEQFGLARNPYDRLGHFAQGFVPAIVVRECLLRLTPLKRGAWLFFIVTCVCLAISALYELVEWWSALAFGDSAESFLGTQGDQWDTQWDMFLALIGATFAQIILPRVHDGQMSRV